MVSEGQSEYCGPHSASIWFLHLSLFSQITVEKKKGLYIEQSVGPQVLSQQVSSWYSGKDTRGLTRVTSFFCCCDLHRDQKQLGREKGLFPLILSGHPPSLREANLGNSSVEVPSSQVMDYSSYQINKTNQLNGFLFVLISRPRPYS